MLTAVAALLDIAGIALFLNVGGAASFTIRHLTSKNLGTLAPGYAASRGGFRVYSVLVLSLGLALSGLTLSAGWPLAGFGILTLGVILFAIASVLAIVGEARTFKQLPPKDR